MRALSVSIGLMKLYTLFVHRAMQSGSKSLHEQKTESNWRHSSAMTRHEANYATLLYEIRREKAAKTYRGWTTVMMQVMPSVVIRLTSRLGDIESVDLTIVCVWSDESKKRPPASMGVLLSHYPLYVLTPEKRVRFSEGTEEGLGTFSGRETKFTDRNYVSLLRLRRCGVEVHRETILVV